MAISTRTKAQFAAVGIASALLLTACGGGTSTSTSGAAGVGEIDPTAVLTVAYAGTSKNLDPLLQDTLGGWGYVSLLYDRLTMVDEQDNLVPGLATAWEFAPDGSYLELKLRDGVTFNDGAKFDAAAVAANIKRGQTLPGSTAKGFKAITAVTPVDDLTVRLELAPGGGVELPGLFSTPVGMMVSPTAIAAGADLRNGPGMAGSGAYLVDKYVPSESLSVKRSDREYWDPEGGRLAGMQITTMPEASTRLNGVQTGALDASWVSSASEVVQAQTLSEKGVLNIEKTPFRSTLGVYLRPRGDMANAELRQAVAYSIDPAAVNALFSGNCTPSNQFFTESSWAYDDDYKYPYAYDPAKAKALLAKNGGASVNLTFGAGSNTEKPSNVLQALLSDNGFDASLNPTPLNQLEPRYMAGDFDQMVSNAMTPKMDPAETVEVYMLDGYDVADGDPEIAALAKKAADPTMPEDQRAALYKQISAKTLEKAFWIPICHQTLATIFNDKVVGADALPWANQGVFDPRTLAMTK